MRTWCLVLGLAAFLFSSPGDAKPEDRPPAELMVSVALGPADSLRGLKSFVDAIQPGAGAQITDEVIRGGLADELGASSLDGADPTAWFHILMCDSKAGHQIALLVKVADARTLSASARANHVLVKGGWAVVGPKPLVERVGPYALAVLAPQPTPSAPSATIYLPTVLARYRTQVEAFRKQFSVSMAAMGGGGSGGTMGQLMESYIDGVLSAARDTEKVLVTLDATPAGASLDLALAPRPNSRLAKFVAVQRPSDYALIGKLPPVSSTFVVGGRFESGPYHDGLLDMMSAMYGAAAGPDLRAAMGAVFKATTGEIALAGSFAPGVGMTMTQLFGVTDAAATDKAFVRILELFKTGRTITMGAMSTTTKSHPATTTHDGVTLRRYDTTSDLSKVPAAQREAMERMMRGAGVSARIAAFDNLGMVVIAGDSATEANRVIDAARGKGTRFTPPAAITELIESSRARKESVVFAIDIGGIMASFTGATATGVQPIVMSLGFADRNAHFRIAAPTTTLRTLKSFKP